MERLGERGAQKRRSRLNVALGFFLVHLPAFIAIVILGPGEEGPGPPFRELLPEFLVWMGAVLCACVAWFMFFDDTRRNEALPEAARRKWRWLILVVPHAVLVYWWLYVRPGK